MNAKTQRILVVLSLAMPLLLAGAIFLFPATAWETWGSLHEVTGNQELANDANRKARRIQLKRDFKKEHGKEGAWVRLPRSHVVVAAQRHNELTGRKALSGVQMPDGSTEIYISRDLVELFTPHSLDEHEQGLKRN